MVSTIAVTIKISLVTFGLFVACQAYGASRIDLPVQERLDVPETVASSFVRLTDFAGFIATSFKVPLLVEVAYPLPDLTIPAGKFSARQLLDQAVRQLHSYGWQDDRGVAHLYEKDVIASRRNLLNVRIHRFWFPDNVAEFDYYFRPCIYGTTQGYDCIGGAFSGIKPPDLKKEQLPKLEAFKDVPARSILLRALQANGHFYVVIVFEKKRDLMGLFPLRSWNMRSLVPDEP